MAVFLGLTCLFALGPLAVIASVLGAPSILRDKIERKFCFTFVMLAVLTFIFCVAALYESLVVQNGL